MKKLFFLGLIGLMFSSQGMSQSFGDIYEKSIVDNSAIDYPFLREADVIWSKRIWRLVDLREKMNLPLYYPVQELADGRMSLVNIILGELKAGNLNAYDGSKMTVNVTYSDIEKLMGAGADTIQVPTMSGGTRDTIITKEANAQDIKQLLLLEEWYFDKKHSRMDVRLIGISPIYIAFDDQLGRNRRTQLFWIRYNDFRNTFAQHEAYNRFNDAQRISFDDLFMQRRFSSIIYGESNVYDDRRINEYKIGKAALYEAEKLKMKLQEFEHDLWEY